MPITVRPITVDTCLPLRQKELWPDRPLDFLRMEGDEQAQHYGLYQEDTLVSCLSVFPLTNTARQIRKFATDAAFQRQGYGSRLLTQVLDKLHAEGINDIMLNARLTATEFYLRFGFQVAGEVCHKEGVAYVKMTKTR
ncbi:MULTISPECIES: GNAT family N-acetyltransferase [unclassified Symbiopectobacterium]|uniref:GNAT family N-acetyltransferase n=1 Tax=unclassified Symbiopectobacterium TaxID=2794573 RepID=UPI002227FECA|nr:MULTISPECIES: GNAT family N-acetyltransferase [unclassified Symbiopectobacterium]MCW2473166.1 GNAT family N-acetyltransferase [Candidatus Symbiopectobacterium sp. NZEC151]MCW2482931.1 GNAT family N-acetyltransferase [Candidatus Symbiopectobacterium sp. NZEC135]MCW2484338.1 GNAT family N-acetyltransferase [Candidatus Symbiopectobacterium sp. NZEC127]